MRDSRVPVLKNGPALKASFFAQASGTPLDCSFIIFALQTGSIRRRAVGSEKRVNVFQARMSVFSTALFELFSLDDRGRRVDSVPISGGKNRPCNSGQLVR